MKAWEERQAANTAWFKEQREKYPAMFKWATTPAYEQDCGGMMCTYYQPISQGFECGIGWKSLIDELLEKLVVLNVQVIQIKEKFGSLRIYVEHDYSGWVTPANQTSDLKQRKRMYADEADRLIAEAEEACSKTCEDCGSTKSAKLRDAAWLRVQCDECLATRDEDE